jgi:hypothetical protein
MRKENKRTAAGVKTAAGVNTAAGGNRKVKRDFFASLCKTHQCTILITCTDPKEDGSLDIEMTYTGEDPCLASFMIEKAQEKLDQDLLLQVQNCPEEF